MSTKSKQINDLLKNINKDFYNIKRNLHSYPAVYVIYHYNTEKIYVGSTHNLYNRINQHKQRLFNNTHRNKNLQNAFNIDKLLTFNFIKTDTKEEAVSLEQEIINLSDKNTLFNIATDARLSGKGLTKSIEQRKILSTKTKKQFESIEARQKHSELSKQQWSKLDNLNKLEQAMKHRGKDPLFKKENSDRTKTLWNNLDYRKRVSEKLKGRKIKSVEINGVIYRSMLEAGNCLNLSFNAIKRRVYSDNPIFSNYKLVNSERV